MSLFSDVDDDNASKFGKLVSVETFTGITNNLNYMIDSMPIGSKIPVLVGISGVPTPNPDLWQLCEGGVLADVNSRLNGKTLPDDRGFYPKGATTVGLAGVTSGSNTRTWSHAHGGATGNFGPIADNSSTGIFYITVDNLHNHGIAADLTSPINVEPSHILVKWFIKIR